MLKTNKTADSLKAAAAALRQPVTIIKSAKASGCDAFRNGRVDLDLLREWLAANAQGGRKARKSFDRDSVKEGAAFALKRLEGQEAELFCEMEESPTHAEREIARAAWLKVSEQLRRHDLALEEHRKLTGELVARQDIEIPLEHIGTCINWACQAAADRLAGTRGLTEAEYHAVQAALISGVRNSFYTTAMKPWRPEIKPPTWAADAVIKGFRCQ